MISYRYTRAAAIILLAILLAVCSLQEWSYWFLLIPVGLYIAISAYGSYFIQSNYYVKAYCRARSQEKVLALTFDDGPHPVHTPVILDILEKYQVKAAFFVIGSEAEKYPHLLQKIHQQGHIIGNHSFEHNFAYSVKSKAQLIADADLCDELIREIIKKTPSFYRPPYGVTNPNIRHLIQKKKYYCIGWSLRTYDTMAKSAKALSEKSLKQLQNGDVVLFHDRLAITCEALPAFLEGIKNKGFRTERIDTLFQLPAYS
jgi:peptidoglycan/xylan/chitin deacetylase (PgdA/CDA1 family)